MTDIIPTRGAALDLTEEMRFLQTGFEFLDEKRMLLASKLLDELEHLRAARRAYDEAMAAAVAALKAAIARHGVESLALYPTGEGALSGLDIITRNFLGLDLLESPLTRWTPPGPVETLDASEAAEACRTAFALLVPPAVRLAVCSTNIRRLIREYRATERRSRALENVMLPETAAKLAWINEFLTEIDQEESLRIRNARR